MIASIKGYKAIIIAPDSTSDAKKKLMEFYGAEILLTDNREGINTTVEKAYKVAEQQGAYLLNQFQNLDNPKAHHSTGKEILYQVGAVDVFIAGVGTGGTLIGVGETLKKEDPDTRLVAMEPSTAPALYNMFHEEDLPIGSGIPHTIEGIGETFVPEILMENIDIIDDVVLVNDNDAFGVVSDLSRFYGYCTGISSGANVYVAWNMAKILNRDKKVVTVLPDSGQRYLTQF
jgi:cysteine synthase A